MKEALILVAHADDETLGAGGTISKLVESDWIVSVVILSDTKTYGRAGVENRSGAEAACEILGVHELQFLDIPDQKFDSVPMAELANSVAQLKLTPDLIITNSSADLNLDHRLVCDVAKIIGRPRQKPVSLLECEIPNTSFWNGTPFPANFYVDISDHIDRKIEAFKQYKHEISKFPDPWSERGLRLLAEYHGMQSGIRYAEAFTVIRGYEGRLPGCDDELIRGSLSHSRTSELTEIHDACSATGR